MLGLGAVDEPPGRHAAHDGDLVQDELLRRGAVVAAPAGDGLAAYFELGHEVGVIEFGVVKRPLDAPAERELRLHGEINLFGHTHIIGS